MLRCCNLDFLPLDCSRDYKLQIVYNTWHFLTWTCTIAAKNAAQNHSGVWTGRYKAKGSPAQIVCQKGGGPKYLLWVVTTGLPTVVLIFDYLARCHHAGQQKLLDPIWLCLAVSFSANTKCPNLESNSKTTWRSLRIPNFIFWTIS